MIATATVAALVSSAFVATAPAANAASNVTITGRVTNQQGTNLQNVTVQVRPNPNASVIQTVFTDANGNYSVTVPSGSYQILASINYFNAPNAGYSTATSRANNVFLSTSVSRVKKLAGFRSMERWGWSGRPGPGGRAVAGSRTGLRAA